jgi:RNA polymerase sigma-70 factor, ECF subfamily
VTISVFRAMPLPVRADLTASGPTRSVSHDDHVLIDALRRGDRAAIAQVYRAHHRKVRAYAARMLGDRTAAEDVVHDVFVSLPTAIERFRSEAKLDTFLVAIAVNLCRRRLRGAARAQRAASSLSSREPPLPEATPEHETSQRRLADALHRALFELSLDHREVFMLCAVEERSSREVAEILDIPEGTVRTRLFHARKLLRARLEEET